MAYLALNTFAGTGGLMQVELSFAGYNSSDPSAPAPYFNVADIKAVVVTPATSTSVETEVPVAITKIGTMTFKTVAAVPVGKNLRIYRETNISSPVVDFVSLQVVSERDLDNSAKQTLYAVMEAKDQAELAGVTADSASAVATAANVASAAATSTANAAAGVANTALTTANAAVGVANSATGTANAAAALASSASTAATQASADAAAVLGVANTANANAATALSTANTAKATADGIANTAATANSNASTALSTANTAKATADGIADTANSANTNASQALTTANAAQNTANGVAGTANTALSTAQTAATNAQAALDGVNNATTSLVAEGTNLYFTQTRVRSTLLTGLSLAVSTAVVAGDTLLAGIGKLQAQITALIANVFTKAEITALVSNPNLLLNAYATVNQRAYASNTATTTANQYTVDRWKVATLGQRLILSASGAGNIMTAPAGGLTQVVETVANPGGVFTLSWTGTATATVNGTAITNGGQTASLTAGTTITVTFSNGTVYGPKLERGNQVTAPVILPYALELAACRRFYQYGKVNMGGYSVAGVGNVATQKFDLMRVVPTLSYIPSAPANVSTYDMRNLTQQSVDAYCIATNATPSGYAVTIDYFLTAEL